MKGLVLIVEDDRNISRTLSTILQSEDYEVLTAPDFAEGRRLADNPGVEVVLLDVKLPDRDGIQLLQHFTKTRPDVTVVMMSGHGSIEDAVRATQHGAYDFLEKPISLEKLLITVENARKLKRVTQENTQLKLQIGDSPDFLWKSPAMAELMGQVGRVAPTAGRVLVTGENGTGKERVAHAIHTGSPRSSHPFIRVNCAAIPSELIESELFGHVKGAFTDAQQDKPGKFELAHRGSILLDEIGDMALQTQAKVLRVLEQQEFERVGGAETIRVDVRVIAATNKNLPLLVEQGQFRQDLYYRLNVVPLRVPSLRERREDIPLLAEYYGQYLARQMGLPSRKFTPAAMELLAAYDWPGNVRELKNMIERVCIMIAGEQVEVEDVRAMFRQDLPGSSAVRTVVDDVPGAVKLAVPAGLTFREAEEHFGGEYIKACLLAQGGNVAATARELGLERSHLYKKMRALGIEREEAEVG